MMVTLHLIGKTEGNQRVSQDVKNGVPVTQKLYAGAKLREIRTRCNQTQKDFSTKLGISLPYYCQMENNTPF
jgi:DNA-binding XRE family transcriptional regulator